MTNSTQYKLLASFSLLLLTQLSACSSKQAYGAGQAWQRNECDKMVDAQDRSRCMASASTSFDEYKRQQEAAQGKK